MTNEELLLTTAAAAKAAAGELGGLGRVLSALSGKLHRIFAGLSLARYLGEATVSTGKLRGEMTALKAALTRLQTTLGNALVPIAKALLPVLQQAVNWVTNALRYLGKLTQALFGSAEGQDAFSKATEKASKTASRSLASFDQLNRIQSGSATGAASTGSGGNGNPLGEPELTFGSFYFLQHAKMMLDALKALDFQPLLPMLQAVWQALEPLAGQLCAGLYWAFWNVFYPMSQWAVETLLPLVLENLRLILENLNTTIDKCRPAFLLIWQNTLKPMGQWTADKLVEGLEWLMEKMEALSIWLEHNEIPVEWLLGAAGAALAVLLLINAAMALFNSRTSSGTGMVQLLTAALNALSAPVQMITAAFDLLNTGLLALSKGWQTVRNDSLAIVQAVRGDWQTLVSWFQTGVLATLRDSFRTAVNNIINFFNTMLRGITSGINNLITALNRISISIPDWVPELGGSTFGINLPSVRTPQIPLLAKGAVLPANRPFMAVVGDQRHGTNIEAPLETIQQAVALVMEDVAAGQTAGQEAVVGILGQILEAVLGISIGDGDIAMAVDRYNSRRAVIAGQW